MSKLSSATDLLLSSAGMRVLSLNLNAFIMLVERLDLADFGISENRSVDLFSNLCTSSSFRAALSH